jgi:hypothetical protein
MLEENMKIKDNYERTQVSVGYHNVENCLFETRSRVSGAISRTNFGGSGSQELREAHQVFKKVDRLLYEATRELRDIEDII